MVTVLRSGHFDNTAGDKNNREKEKEKWTWKEPGRIKVRETGKFRPQCSIKMVYISSCGERWYKLTFASPTGTTMLCFSQSWVVVVFSLVYSLNSVCIPELSPACLRKASQHIQSQPPRRIWLVCQIRSGDFSFQTLSKVTVLNYHSVLVF